MNVNVKKKRRRLKRKETRKMNEINEKEKPLKKKKNEWNHLYYLRKEKRKQLFYKLTLCKEIQNK